ncbi:DNA polymerase III subunit alpha, partial [bacterium]
IALYRPGPMEHIPRFIDTKFGKQKAEYLDERMKPILEETYGIIVYQDQVMQLVQALAGFSLGKADVLRRAMGKKDVKAMQSMKVEYMDGCAAQDIAAESAEKVWELLLPFAGYAFNKAHAVCYSILAYQTAYLKANYPTEYMAGLLSVYLDKEDKVTTFIEECRRMKIPVLPPDVNRSERDFYIETEGKVPSIRFGMAAIKGVGEGLVEAIIADRKANGPFIHLFEFCDRTKPCGINRGALEALIRAGALDSIERNRQKLLNHVEGALHYGDLQNKDRLAGQAGLFGEADSSTPAASLPMLVECDPPSRNDCLTMEKEVMGIYVSDHPLRGHERTLANAATSNCASVAEMDENTHVKLAGVIAKLRPIVTKSEGKRMATIVLEDFSGQASGIVFPATYEKLKDKLLKDTIVKLSGSVMHREMRGEKSVEIRIDDVSPLDPVLEMDSRPGGSAGMVTIAIPRATEAELRHLRQLIVEHPGDYECCLELRNGGGLIPIYLTQHISPNDAFLNAVRKGVVRCQVDIRHAEPAYAA